MQGAESRFACRDKAGSVSATVLEACNALVSLSTAETKVALIQRSCGYALRPTLDIAEIDMAVQVIKSQQPSCIGAVDNCYGEFTASREPCAVNLAVLPAACHHM